ncbi:helix-turn-helix domain-containing protein [Salipiger thiooxidans]|uniref:helix-turn-helix domain-containing protein n=1 Tax=Salipiger thiooxidans TaxID=282683 RepID=UPI001CD46FC7|nr:helix-turn-helix transcriptional regulator [Salipiger thiooxidans]
MPRIVIKLREALEAYEARTGERLTHDELARLAGLSRSTLDSIASRRDYNPSLRVIEQICVVLRCAPGDLLAMSFEERND